jgi:hypothetical protein
MQATARRLFVVSATSCARRRLIRDVRQKYMITRRKLTAKEQEALALRLEEMKSSIQESYEYPLDDLIDNLKQEALALRLEEMKSSIQESYDYSFDDWIDNLKNSKQINNNEVEEDSNRALRYFLHFSSPNETWEMLCGRAGIYTVDARSLKALDFQLTVMN